MYVPKNRFTTEGLVLYNENKNTHAYVKEFISFNRRMGDKKEIILEDNAGSIDSFFQKLLIFARRTIASRVMLLFVYYM